MLKNVFFKKKKKSRLSHSKSKYSEILIPGNYFLSYLSYQMKTMLLLHNTFGHTFFKKFFQHDVG